MIKLSYFIVVFISLSFFATISAAEDIKPMNCFSVYNFTDSYFQSLHVDKSTYNPGGTIRGSVGFTNINNYPLPELYVRALVFYVGDTFVDRPEGNDMVDDFAIASDVNLLGKRSADFDFTWKVPANAKSGTYMIAVYLGSKSDFSFAGLTFLPEVLGKYTLFDVSSGASGLFHFDKNKVTYNGDSYKFRSMLDTVSQPIKVDSILVNDGPSTTVSLTYEVYKWSDNSKTNRVSQKSDSFSLASGQSKQLTYTIDNLPNDIYQLVITAVTQDGRKAIIKPRFPADVNKGNFIFLGLDKFPLTKGSSSIIYSCFSNSAYSDYVGKQVIEVRDANDKVVKSYTFDSVNYTGAVDGMYADFSPSSNMYKLTLVGKTYDSSGSLQKQVNVVYDATKFGLTVPAEETPVQTGFDYSWMIVFLAVGVVVIFVIYIIIRRR